MQTRVRALGSVAITATLLVSSAFSDDVGVGAKVVDVVQRPGKARVKVLFQGAGAENTHKGASGPAEVYGQMTLCVEATLGSFSTGPFQRNSDEMASFRAPAGENAEGLITKAIVKPGKSSRWIAHSLGGMNLAEYVVPSPPVRGALAVAITNLNDNSFHRFCADIEGAEAVRDRPLANGAGRRITWRNVPPDPDCAHFDATLPVICSPSGAFLDGAESAFY